MARIATTGCPACIAVRSSLKWGSAVAATAAAVGTHVAIVAASFFIFGAIAIVLAAGALMGTLHDRRDFFGSLGALLWWGLAQQWVLQTVVLSEAQRATSRRLGIWIAAAIFGAIHLPNPFLAAVTFAGALLWCRIYDRCPNILPLAASHALGTLAILHAFDAEITGRLRIGLSYLMLAR